ncbi:MAG: hypothetical protein K9H26_04815 [Prolixibacteraceae bacterium]|nr:hypothetical protein [Prolixibacteraceae bacterium]
MRKIFTLQFLVNIIHSGKTETHAVKDNGEALFEAPGKCVENIMNFARSYKVADSETTGKIEMVLN